MSVDPSRTLPSDVNRMFDLLGIGAAIENIRIAARERGFEPRVELPSEKALNDEPDLAATLTFEAGGERDPLFAQLESRCTNRKLYAKAPPEQVVLERLSESVRRLTSVQVDWVGERERIKALASIFFAHLEMLHGAKLGRSGCAAGARADYNGCAACA